MAVGTTLSAVVRVVDLPTGTTVTGAELFEAVQTTAGVGQSVQLSLSQMLTNSVGALPTGGNTGQILNKLSTVNYSSQWSNITQFLAVGTSLATTGSATSIVAYVPNQGITSTQIANNAVGTNQLASSIGIASSVSVGTLLTVAGTATFNGGIVGVGTLGITGTSLLTGTFGVVGTSQFTGAFNVVGTSLFTSGAFGIVGTTIVTGTLNVSGTATLPGSFILPGLTSGLLQVSGTGVVGTTTGTKSQRLTVATGSISPVWKNSAVNVKDYGAVGDGSTDDTTAINAAITAANNSSVPIYFPQPSVSYRMTASATPLSASGLLVYGDGPDLSVIDVDYTPASSTAAFITMQGGGVQIKDLCIRKANTRTGGYAITNVWGATSGGSDFSILENVKITGTGGTPGTWARCVNYDGSARTSNIGTRDQQITNCNFFNATEANIFITSGVGFQIIETDVFGGDATASNANIVVTATATTTTQYLYIQGANIGSLNISSTSGFSIYSGTAGTTTIAATAQNGILNFALPGALTINSSSVLVQTGLALIGTSRVVDTAGASNAVTNSLQATYAAGSGLARFGPVSGGGNTSLKLGASSGGVYSDYVVVSNDGTVVFLNYTTGIVWSSSTGVISAARNIATGLVVTPFSIGNATTGTITPSPLNHNYQYLTNNGAFTIAAYTTSDFALDLLCQNGTAPGAVGFSGWRVGSVGDSFSTTARLVASAVIATGSPGIITCTAHAANVNDPIWFSTSGALPTGMTSGTLYYISTTTANTLQIATTPGTTTSINLSSTQSGTHTSTYPSQYIFSLRSIHFVPTYTIKALQ